LISLKQEKIFGGQIDIVVRNQVQGVHQNKGQVLVFYGLKPPEGGPFSMVEQEVTGPLRKTDEPFRQAEDLLLFYCYRTESAGFNLQGFSSLNTKKKVSWFFRLFGNPPKSPFTKGGL
jgi:hypothetical protein